MKLGDLLFGIKADKTGLRTATADIKREFKNVGDNIEKTLGKNTLGGLEKKLVSLKKELQGVNIGTKEFRKLQREIKNTEKSLNRASGKASIFTKGLRLLSVVASAFSIYKLREFSDTFNNMQNRLRQVAEGDDLPKLQSKIFEMANDSRVNVEALTDSFVRFDLINKQLGGTQEETGIILDTLSKGLSLTGASASEVSSVMLQLSQAFGSGRLAGDEFRSVSENMPMLLDILAKQLGVNRGALKDLAAQGIITSEVLKEALLEANEQVNESFQKSSLTIGQAMTQATNKFLKKFGELDQTYAITDKIVRGVEGISNVFIVAISTISYFINVAEKAFIVLRNSIGTTIIGIGETIFGTFNTISKNTGILVENMGRAFDNLPGAMEKGIKGAIKLVGSFIDKVTFGLGGKVADALGLQGVVDDINIFGSKGVSFKSFENGFNYKYTKKGLSEVGTAVGDLTDSLVTFSKAQESAFSDRGSSPISFGSTASGKGGAAKIASELEKQEQKRAAKHKKWIEKQEKEENDRLKKRLVFVGDTVQKITDIYDEEIDKSNDLIDDYIDSIDGIKDSLLDLSEESERIKEDLFSFGGTEDQKKMERLLERYSKVLETAGNDETIEGGVSVGDLRSFKKLKDREQEIEEEKNASQLELEALQVKKTAEETILAEFSEKRALIDENYKKIRIDIEEGITDTVYQESLKQEQYQDKLLKKWKKVAAARRDALSSSSSSSSGGSLPGFYNGGYTGDGNPSAVAGEVHHGEYVIPQHMVQKVPEVVSQLERMRQGGTTDNSRNINVPQITVQNSMDAESFFERLKFRL